MTRRAFPKTAVEAARDACRRGWAPLPLPARSKRPAMKEWERYRATEETIGADFDPNGNVGLLLGDPSAGLCDVDCDVPEAATLAARWLPRTGLIHGRPSRPASHLWFVVSPAPRTVRFQDPSATGGSACLVELRGTGGQTVIPPSVHETGESYGWVSYGEPGSVAASELLSLVRRVAAGALLARHWPAPGARHDATLAVAGFLLRGNGNDVEDAVQFIEGVANAAGDEESARRVEDVRDTARRLAEGLKATGRRRLEAFFDPKLLSAASDWLGLSRAREARAERTDMKKLPTIVTRGRPFRDVSSDAIAALRLANDPPTVFVRGGELVTVVESGPGTRRLKPMSEAALRGRLARVADFVDGGMRGDVVVTRDVPPPLDVVRDVAALGPAEWGAPEIDALVHVPVLREDGSILSAPGYDAKTRLFFGPDRDLRVPAIPEAPTSRDVAEAVDLIDEALSGFPFVPDEAEPGDPRRSPSRANAFALLLTPVLRASLDGNVPIALLDAPQPGSGKSLLAEVCARIALGRPAPMLSPPRDDDEWRKQITAALLSGSPLVVFDNLDSALHAGALARAVTSRTWGDRLLGSSRNVEVPQRATWIVTGNNIRLGGDLPRRCYPIRLDAEAARPWQRTGFRHEDLLGWAVANRGRLVAAVLVLCRAWYAAGRPASDSPVLGGFEAWSRAVGGILSVAGIGGFLRNLGALYEEADETGGAWEAFVRALQARFGSSPWGAADVLAELRTNGTVLQALPEELALSYDGEESKGRSFQSRLGRALKRKVGVRFGAEGLHIKPAQGAGGTGGVARYAVGAGSSPPRADRRDVPETSETLESFSTDLYAREISVGDTRACGTGGIESPMSPKSPPPCPTCGGRDFWTSHAGVETCRRCHPPAPGAEKESR